MYYCFNEIESIIKLTDVIVNSRSVIPNFQITSYIEFYMCTIANYCIIIIFVVLYTNANKLWSHNIFSLNCYHDQTFLMALAVPLYRVSQFSLIQSSPLLSLSFDKSFRNDNSLDQNLKISKILLPLQMQTKHILILFLVSKNQALVHSVMNIYQPTT